MRILLAEIAVVERLMPLATKLKTVTAMPKFSMASHACVSLPWVHVDVHRLCTAPLSLLIFFCVSIAGGWWGVVVAENLNMYSLVG